MTTSSRPAESGPPAAQNHRRPTFPARLGRHAEGPGESVDVPLDFTAIDFETANPSSASACAVGLVRVRGGEVVDKAGWLIRPPAGHDVFFELNTRIHGIRAEDVTHAATWTQQLADLAAFAGDDILVAHNAGFDMAVLKRACEATGDECPPYRYACSLQVARKVYALESYRLPFVAAEAGFPDFPHHNATADALACAHVMVDAARRLGVDDIDALAGAAGVRVSQIAIAEPPAMSFAVA
jgi:DNA polymerase-3 subunit epsilon